MSRQDYSHKARKKTRRKKPVEPEPTLEWRSQFVMMSEDDFERHLGTFPVEETTSESEAKEAKT